MSAELIILCGLLLVGFAPLAISFRSNTVRLAILLVAALSAATGWYWQRVLERRDRQRKEFFQKSPREGRPGGFVGSGTCQSCHPKEFESWKGSYHRTMTQYPTLDNVRGNFDNVTLQFDNDTYHLQRDSKGFWVEMVDPDLKYLHTLKQAAYREGRQPAPPNDAGALPRVRLPITLMTGSHHMQTYWVPSRIGNLQFNLPFTYIFESQQWAPRHDVFLLNPDKHYTMQMWNLVCINCHTTAGQPRQDPKTKLIDSQTAEIGISCEACHSPGAEHARINASPVERFQKHRTARPDPTIFNPARADHVKASEACGQCHAIRLNIDQQNWLQNGVGFKAGGDLEKTAPLAHYEDPNTPGTPNTKRVVMEGSFWNDGQVRVSGRDFNGLAASPCFQRGKLSCLSCHSMHDYQSNVHQLAPRMESNAACLQCHEKFTGKIEEHTHHAANSSGSLCYNCHMPRTSYGLLKAIRSHTISSPNAKVTIETGRPDACNLCHLDRTLGWTANRLNEWYRQPVPALDGDQTNVASAITFLLSGDAGQRALLAWHMGWAPAREISGDDWIAPYLAELLTDPYSVVRYIAQRSLKRLPGFSTFDYDYIGPAGDREAARNKARAIWAGRRATVAGGATTLLHSDGTLDDVRFRELLKLRNDRPMELIE